jgi:pyrroline-5-carboxylate reductase
MSAASDLKVGFIGAGMMASAIMVSIQMSSISVVLLLP